MDTKFWGPDGWILLHRIAYNYPQHPTPLDKENYMLFFNSLQNVLPCIFCRNSYIEFLKELPILNYLESKYTLTKWLYLIHNKVNNKLRLQGFLHTQDPDLLAVNAIYNKPVKTIYGWDFIYCIILNYPEMEHNPTMKLKYYMFFKYLTYVYPIKKIKDIYTVYFNTKSLISPLNNGRDKLIEWFYNFHKLICDKFSITIPSYTDTCNKYEAYRAGCNKGNTCRKQ